MGQILKDIYSEVGIASFLGFKGGSCAYFFYNLPRFSVDLDFDFLGISEDEQKTVLEKLKIISQKYGAVKENYLKKNTIFILLSYGEVDHNIKLEISIRKDPEKVRECYELKEYLGISILAAKKDCLFSSKLLALTLRKELAMRDVYDICYFAKNRWDINEEMLAAETGKKLKVYLAECLKVVEKIKDNQILHGLGELVNKKEKDWIKKNLKKETTFLLKNYLAAIK